MKKIILFAAAFMMILASCNHEHAKKPESKFGLYQNVNGTSVAVDTILYNTVVDLKFEGPKCDRVVYFLGPITKNISNPSSKGSVADGNGNLMNTKILRLGNDTIACIASNVGEWGTEVYQDTAYKYIYIYKP